MAECQRVAQGDEITGFFGGHDAGQARHPEHVAFLGAAAGNQGAGGGQHLDAAAGDGPAPGGGFIAHVHHMRLALGVEVGQGWGIGGFHGGWTGRLQGRHASLAS